MPVLRISDEASDYLRELAEKAGTSMTFAANSLLRECQRRGWKIDRPQAGTYVLTSGDG